MSAICRNALGSSQKQIAVTARRTPRAASSPSMLMGWGSKMTLSTNVFTVTPDAVEWGLASAVTQL
ncbi:hypothetical protein GCM10022248_83620 [Nonomuraea soli]